MIENSTPPGWTNDATYRAQLHLSSMRYGELMSHSRAIFREEAGADRSMATQLRFAEYLRGLLTADKLAGHFVGIGLDDVDFVQLADHWLGGIEAYRTQQPS